MLSLLPSSQLILALWLLATVAPAATALLNGSVMPFAVAEGRVKVSVRDAGCAVEVESKEANDKVSLDWLDWCDLDGDDGESLPLPKAGSVASLEGGDIVALCDLSVLQTGLQRHRPKAS